MREEAESPVREFGPCVKCGSSEVNVNFHDGKWHCSSCRRANSCQYAKACGEYGKKGEHLRIHCRRCGWDWLEKVGYRTNEAFIAQDFDE